MNGMDELYRWNAWFDAQTPNYRFDLAIWAVVALGLLNLLLTLAFGMAFGLLLLLGLILANVARLPYALGDLPPPAAAGDPTGAASLQTWHRRIVEAPNAVVSLPIFGIALAAIFGMGSLAALSAKAGPAFGILFILTAVNALAVIRGHSPARPQPAPVAQPQRLLAIEDQQQSSTG